MNAKIDWREIERQLREIKSVPADPDKMAQYDLETEKKLEKYLARHKRYRAQSELEAMKILFD